MPRNVEFDSLDSYAHFISFGLENVYFFPRYLWLCVFEAWNHAHTRTFNTIPFFDLFLPQYSFCCVWLDSHTHAYTIVSICFISVAVFFIAQNITRKKKNSETNENK